jgi:hypothetical protein
VLKALDVIRIMDVFIRPPGPKMVVCVEPSLGFFFRINSEPKWQTPIPLKFRDYPEFLTHDSYLECGCPFELDEYTVYESIRDNGILGRLKTDVVPQIIQVVQDEQLLSPADKSAIIATLSAAKDW